MRDKTTRDGAALLRNGYFNYSKKGKGKSFFNNKMPETEFFEICDSPNTNEKQFKVPKKLI